MAIHKTKYQQIILYLCQKLGGELKGKKILAKLLYFVDFDLYEKSQKGVTGEKYFAYPMGPFPETLENITKDMADNKLINIRQDKGVNGYNPTEVYKCLVEPDLSIFDEEEKKMLDRIVLKYGNLSGKQLEELSHAEAPYIGTELKKEIPYELAFYRGTDFNDF